MEFSRHADVREERISQIAHALRDLYPLTVEVLPLTLLDQLKQLNDAEQGQDSERD